MRAALLFLLLGPLWDAQATPETDREILRTFVNYHVQNQDFDGAQAAIREHLRGDPSDAGAWNILGITQVRAQDLKAAKKSFYQAAKIPGVKHRGVYLYNYADLLARTGDKKRAMQTLQVAMRFDSVESSASDALSSLRSGGPVPKLLLAEEGVGDWQWTFSLGSGYDTNVLLLSQTTLSQGSTTAGASLFELAATKLSKTTTYSSSQLVWGVGSNFVYQNNKDAQAYNSSTSTAQIAWGGKSAPGKFHGRLSNDFSISLANTDGFTLYNWTDVLGWKGTWRGSGVGRTEVVLPVLYQNYPLSSSDSEDNDRTGLGFQPAVYQIVGLGSWELRFGGLYEQILAKGNNYKSSGFSAPLSISRNIFWKLRMTIGGAYTRTNYPKSDVGRVDNNLKGSLGLNRAISRRFYASLDYGYERNKSNDAEVAYEKHAVSMVLTYAIF